MQVTPHGIAQLLARAGFPVLLACVGLALSCPSFARAQTVADPDYYKQTVERQQTVNRFIYSQSPQPIPSSYSAAREAEQILAEHARSLPASNPEARSLWARLYGVAQGAELSPGVRALGTIGLGVTAFDLGWKIGTGINAKFLKIGIPAGTDGPMYYRWDRMSWRSAGSRSFFGASYPAQEGWVVEAEQTCCTHARVDRWFGEPCEFSGFVPPAPFVIQGPVLSTGSCSAPGGIAPVDVYYGWAPEDALAPTAAVEPYTNQPYEAETSTPTPPAQSTVEQTIEDELDKPENHIVRDWLNYQLGSPGERDPISGDVNMPECAGATINACTATLEDLGITDYQVQTLPESNLSFANGEVVTSDPQPGTSVDPATVTITIAANPATRVKSDDDERCERDTYSVPGDPGPAPADGTGIPQYQAAPTPWNGPYAAFDPATTPWQPVSVVMRYGLQPGNINEGWGWRHVKAKHGYGATEMNETAQALATDPAPTMMFASTRQYAFHLYYEMPDGPGTVWCVRTAVIQLEPDNLQLRMGDASPKGVINSYTGLLLGTMTS